VKIQFFRSDKKKLAFEEKKNISAIFGLKFG
jgi:hypothetical protein